MFRIGTVFVVAAVMAIVLTACGGAKDTIGESSTAATSAGNPQATSTSADPATDDGAAEQAQDLGDDMAQSLADQQDASGGGGAALTVGETTWTFDSVLCAFGPEEIGQEGAEFVLSSVQDGLQLYVSIDSFGHSVSLDDISDFENPSVSLSADPFTAAMTQGPEEFVEVDGKAISATALFLDGTTDSPEPIEGTLQATCP